MATRIFITVAAILSSLTLWGGTKEQYVELPNHKPGTIEQWSLVDRGVTVGFTSADCRHSKSNPALPELSEDWNTVAWRGERVHTQFVVRALRRVVRASVQVSDAHRADGARINAENITVGMVRYVMGDGLSPTGHGNGILPRSQSDSTLFADVIDNMRSISIDAMSVQPFWLTVRVPRSVAPGIYNGSVAVNVDGNIYSLPYSINVRERTLPKPADWSFHLDLWQNPYSVARYHNVTLWSKQHFAAMTPYMQMLAEAGQKTVTVSMIYDPWQGQTYDKYGSMIGWTKLTDGTWSYDYTIFDKWVEYMGSMGIDKLINCYSMIPWNCKFYYYDKAAQRDTLIVAQPGTPEFDAHWRPMLKDFATHLKAKGWFDKCAIAMDERPMEAMQAVIKLVKSVDPDFKISLAGSYHDPIEPYIYDYCIALAEQYPEQVVEKRRAKGLPTTVYTCCVEGRPNTFVFSPTAEATWFGFYAASRNYSGYLRWAYNCWPQNPLQDARFGTWSAGDTFLVYPAARSSIRFERLIEGIQYYEKIRILREEFAQKSDTTNLRLLNSAMEGFDPTKFDTASAQQQVNRAKMIIDKL